MEQCRPPADVKRTKHKPLKPLHPPPKPPKTLPKPALKVNGNGNFIQRERMEISAPILSPEHKPRSEELNNAVGFNQNKRTKMNKQTQEFNMNMQYPSVLEKNEKKKGEEEEVVGREKVTEKVTEKSQSSGILKEIKEKLRPVKSTEQMDREARQSEGPEYQGEETDNRQDKGVLGGIFGKIPKERTPTFTSYITDTNPEREKSRPGNKQISSEYSPDPHSVETPQTHSTTDTKLETPKNKQSDFSASNDSLSASTKENESTHSELSASNDSLSDTNTKEKGGIFSGMFRKSPKPSGGPTPEQDNLSTHSELSTSNDSLSDTNTKEKGGMLTGMFRRAPKPAEHTLSVQENESTHSELSASNDSLSDTNTQEKGGMFGGMFRKSPKPSGGPTPEQDNFSRHSELSASNDSLSDTNRKEKGGKLTGMFRRAPKPAEHKIPVQKGGVFSGMFRKTPKPSGGPTPEQDNLSTHSELSASNDRLSDANTKEKEGMLTGRSPKSAEHTVPVQENESPYNELSASNDSLSDTNTKEKGGMFGGMFRKSPKPSGGPTPEQDNLSTHSELSASNDCLSDNNNTKEKGGKFTGMFRRPPKCAERTVPVQVSMETESGTPAGGEERLESLRKRRVSFRVKRTLPRAPKEEEEEYLRGESIELEELPSVQESSVEIQMVEMAPLPSEDNPLEDDDGLLEWWRTVEGWDAWNESSNFREDEEDLAVEQAADRVYMAAQLFVRLFNQRGASLQQRILELLSVADTADSFHKRAVAASMGGGVASVVGSVTTITGLILAPFTFGTSIIVTAVGIGVATAGSIASASANITDTVYSNMDRKKVEKMIQGYQEELKDIRECMDFVQEGMDALQERDFEKYTESVAKRALNQNVKHVVKEGVRAGKALMINTDQLVSTVQVLSVAGGAAKAAQAISITTGVMSALFLALDIFFLAKDSHELRKGAKTKFATKIREVCKELQDGLLELNRVKTDLQKTMDGIEVEEYEEEDEDEEEESDLESDPEKLALLEEEINQIEEKLDQQAQEKKSREGEAEGGNEKSENDSKEEHLRSSEDGKMDKVEKGGEMVKEDGDSKRGKSLYSQLEEYHTSGFGPGMAEEEEASRKERKDLVVSEITRIEQEELRVKSVAQGQQGRWTTWEGVASRAINWADFWKLPQARLSFLIRATYDTLPSPQNLHQWLGTEQSCDLCGTINASLQHILSGCKTALTQGRLTWRHDQVLRKLAEVLEKCGQEANSQRPSGSQQRIHFLRQGEPTQHKRPPSNLLTSGAEWKMKVDLGRQLQFPQEICSTTLRPDVVLWSAAAKSALLIELTVPWEEGLEAAYERKMAKYADLVAECRESGWSVRMVESRKYTGLSRRLRQRYKMEHCMSPADVKQTKHKQSLGVLKELKKKLRPIQSTAQMDREASQSEGNQGQTEDQRKETDNRQIRSECSPDPHSVETSQTHSTTDTELEATENKQENESTHSELSGSNDGLFENNTKKKGGKLTGLLRKSPKPAECTLLVQDNISTHSELSASNDSLSDTNTKEKGGIFSGMFRKSPKLSRGPTPEQDNLSTHGKLSASNDSLSDISTKISSEYSPDPHSVETSQTHSTTDTELETTENKQKKGGKLTGLFRKSPKPAERTLPAQGNISTYSELSASNDSLSDTNTKEKGGMFSGMFRKSPKPSRGPTPEQDNLSTHSELSASNNSLSDINTKENESTHSELSGSNDSLSDNNTKKKGGKFTGRFQKSPKPSQHTPPVQDNLSTHSELSASNDSLSDKNTKKKGRIFTGMFGKSAKPSTGPTPEQDNVSTHSELSDSNDSLSEAKTKMDMEGSQSEATEDQGGNTDNQQDKRVLGGLFWKIPKERTPTFTSYIADTNPEREKSRPGNKRVCFRSQETESTHSELSASNDSLSDINTKEKGGIFSGMFRKSPKPSGDPTPAQDNLSTHSELSDSNDSISDNNNTKVSMETESGTTVDDKMREKTLRSKRRVSFRVKRTLPRAPKVLFQSATKEEEEYLRGESVELEELPSVQESSVEIQMVEMAPLPSEQNLLDSVQDDDGLLEWWRTVDGWDEWNKSSDFKEDEEDLAVEQVADRVYLAAQLFVRLFNQRGASLQQRILELLSVADAADSFHKRTLAASMGGRVASVVGSVTTITGLILAPFTFGSSIIVTAVGIGVATAGTIASASANITDSVHSNMDRKKVEKMIEGYQEEIKDIRECMDFVQEGMDALQERNFEKYTESVAKRALNRNIKHVVKEGVRAGKALMINTDKLVSTVQVLSVAGGAAKAAQAISVTTGVMSALFLALDIFFLAKDSHELRKGAKTKFATKIREVCKELQDGLLELNRVKTDLQKTMDGIEVEEYEEEDEDEEEESDLESDPEKLALLEEEINQIEEKLDQQALEKKTNGEEGREKKKREDDISNREAQRASRAEEGMYNTEAAVEFRCVAFSAGDAATIGCGWIGATPEIFLNLKSKEHSRGMDSRMILAVTVMMGCLVLAVGGQTSTNSTNSSTAPSLLTFQNITVELLTITVNRIGCGLNKLCEETPADCDPAVPGSCLFFSSSAVSSISGPPTDLNLEMSGESRGYIVLILSPDRNLGNDDAFICAQQNGNIYFFTADFNNNVLTLSNRSEVANVRGSLNGNVIQCTFTLRGFNATIPRTAHFRVYSFVGIGSFNGTNLGEPTILLSSNGSLSLGNPTSNLPSPAGGNSGATGLHHTSLALLVLLSALILRLF
ncbi:hypothetical protein AAFF_G00438910 [Aldrovandia affinis]|uniref:Uncharacterized protein n=1 Tax=Aldrovandia affinis TaxID=143900 RepID=A0AAD7S7X4_9TELE|nr:hypothetical protein AAFF_G00438910 [Aldrovandia affinis]